MTYVQGAVIDCADHVRVARFWAQVLGARWGTPMDGWAVVDADPILLAFQQVLEPKPKGKNRVHLDIHVDSIEEALTRAIEAGGNQVSVPEFDGGDSGYVVLRDVEDNEFCLVTDPSGSFMAHMRANLRDVTLALSWHGMISQ